MTVAARLSGVGTFSAFEFDDTTNTSFSISVGSTVFSNEFDENTATTLSGNQRMSATSTGGVIVLDSINEIDPFGDVDTTNLELHLDSVDSPVSSTTISGHPIGQQNYTSSGTFTVPTGVTSVDIVVVGGGGGGGGSDDPDETGGGGGGGALAYVNTISTTPGESLDITVGTGGAGGAAGGGNGAAGNASSVVRPANGGNPAVTLVQANGGSGGQHRGAGGAGGTVVTGTGGSGGAGGAGSDRDVDPADGGGGGGAGGYSGNGGAGAAFNDGNGGDGGSGGAAGGGGSGTSNSSRGGGGVGILGEGTSGAASSDNGVGQGGSGGANGTFNGGLYGGGGAGAAGDGNNGANGANGAVRIIWGDGRSYPSTNTGDLTPGTPTETIYYWEDISGNNRDAVFKGTAYPNNPKEGNFVDFSSANNEYAVLDGSVTGASAYTGVTGTNARTILIAFKPDALGVVSKPFSYGTNTAGNRFTFNVTSNNEFQVLFGNTNGYAQTGSIITTGWNVFAVVVPATGTINDVGIWYNGIEQTLTFDSGTTSINTGSTTNVEIGGAEHETAPDYMNGQMAKVMMYSRVLSDLEIKVVYRSFLNRLV